LFGQLDLDWNRRRTSTPTRRRLARWQATDARLVGCADLQALLEQIRGGSLDESRQLCWALLELVAGNDDLAVRVLLQVMIPGLVNEMARWLRDVSFSPRTRHALDGTIETEQILLTEATQAIHDLAGARPRWPVADLIRRAHRLTLRRIRAERAWLAHNRIGSDLNDLPRVPCDTSIDGTGRCGATTAAERLAEVLRDHINAGTITLSEGRMVWLTRSWGHRPEDLAPTYGVSADTFRRRRHRIERRLTNAGSTLP
jgi:hypothetical protein